MKKYLFCILWLPLLFGQCKKSPNNNITTSNDCQAMLEIDSFSNSDVYTTIELYDNSGRLTEDSVVSSPFNNVYYNYAGNSISFTMPTTNQQGTTGSIVLNSAGWPVSINISNDPNSPYSAVYNSDGTLKSISGATGVLEDSIVYVNGNIVSLRSWLNNTSSVTTYSYSSALYTPFDPRYKIFALCGAFSPFYNYGSGSGGAAQGFTPQPFSKNLVQACPADSTSYTYQLDTKDNITYFSTFISLGTFSNTISSRFSYTCQ